MNGATGPAGISGPTGPAGISGPTGPAGVSGPTGPAGISGATGPAGISGATGPAGISGPTGPAGVSGATGPAGVSGPTGPAGMNGPTGSFTGTTSSANITTLYGGTGNFVSLYASTGSFGNLTLGSGTSPALSADANNSASLNSGLSISAGLTGTSAAFSGQIKAQYITAVQSFISSGSANFQTLASVQAVCGTGVFTQFSANTGGFTSLQATGGIINSLSGASLNYITATVGTGVFTGLYAATGGFTQLSATGANITALSGTSHSAVTLTAGTGSFIALSANSGSFTQLAATGANITSLSGTTHSAITVIAGTGSFGQLSTSRSVLDDGLGNAFIGGNLSCTGTLIVGGTGTLVGNVGVAAQNSAWQIRAVGGSSAYPSNSNYIAFQSVDAGKSMFSVSQTGMCKSLYNTLDDGNGLMQVNGGSMTVYKSGGVKLFGVNSSAQVATANNTLDDGSGNMAVAYTGSFGQLYVSNGPTVLQNGGLTIGKAGGNTAALRLIDNGSGLTATLVPQFNLPTNVTLTLPSASGTLVINGQSIVTSAKNTLDDGNGNVSLSGTKLTWGSPALLVSTSFATNSANTNGGIASFFAPNATYAGSAPGIAVGLGASTNNAVQINFNYATSTNTVPMGPYTGTTQPFGSLSTYGVAAASLFWQNGALYSYKNTLDDTQGNMTLAGALLASGTTPQAFPAHAAGIGGLAAGSSYAGVTLTNGGGYIQASSTAGVGGPLVLNYTTGPVLTSRNTLDDGSGSATFAGTMTANQLSITQPVSNAPPYATVLAPSMGTNGNSYGLVVGKSQSTNAAAQVTLSYSGTTPQAVYGIYGSNGLTLDATGNATLSSNVSAGGYVGAYTNTGSKSSVLVSQHRTFGVHAIRELWYLSGQRHGHRAEQYRRRVHAEKWDKIGHAG